MADSPQQPGSLLTFLYTKFDNLTTIFLVVFLTMVLLWVDKHGNSDFEKWLEVFTAGFGGAYLTLTTGGRHPLPGQNGNGNGAPPAPSAPTSAPAPGSPPAAAAAVPGISGLKAAP